jgi:hypothetical protein
MLRVSIAEQKYQGANVARELTARQRTYLLSGLLLRQEILNAIPLLQASATAGVK